MKTVSLLLLSVMALALTACDAPAEREGGSDLLDAILQAPEQETRTDAVEDEEQPYVEGPSGPPSDE